jgi:hypothetical protein
MTPLTSPNRASGPQNHPMAKVAVSVPDGVIRSIGGRTARNAGSPGLGCFKALYPFWRIGPPGFPFIGVIKTVTDTAMETIVSRARRENPFPTAKILRFLFLSDIRTLAVSLPFLKIEPTRIALTRNTPRSQILMNGLSPRIKIFFRNRKMFAFTLKQAGYAPRRKLLYYEFIQLIPVSIGHEGCNILLR